MKHIYTQDISIIYYNNKTDSCVTYTQPFFIYAATIRNVTQFNTHCDFVFINSNV